MLTGIRDLLHTYSVQTTNKAIPVLELFLQGVEKYGLPIRVRSDHGLENVAVAKYMLDHQGHDNGNMITGSSAHNCQVERTHRDVYAGVLTFFAKSFQELEDSNLLGPLKAIYNSDPELFGIDPNGPIPIPYEDYQVTVLEVDIELTAAQSTALATYCHPLQDDNNSGKSIYLRCVQILNSGT